MRVFWYEWVKLGKKKLFLLITFLLAAVNLLTLFNYERYTEAFFYAYEQKESYRAYLSGSEEADMDGYYRQDREAQERYIDSYPAFIGEMRLRAERMTGTAIFADPESFVYRNIMKSLRDFAPLSGITPVADNCFGIRELADYHDGMLFVLIFLAVLSYYVLFYERDMNLLLLLKGSRNGHMPLASAKLGVMVTAAVFYTALQEGGTILLLGGMYGYGNPGRVIQSVSMFRNCAYSLTVAEALLSILLVRISIGAVTACLFYGLGMLFKSAPFVFFISGAGLLMEFAFSRVFSISGAFDAVKCINPFYCWNMRWVLGEYHNLNLFGYPAGKNLCAVIAAALTALLSAAAGLFAFCRTCQMKKEGRLERLMRRIRSMTAFFNRRVSLLYYEFYKMLVQQKKAIVLLALLVWCVSESAGVFEDERYADAETASYHYYIGRLGGRITEDTFSAMEQEEAFFTKVRQTDISSLSSEDYLRHQMLTAQADMLEDGLNLVKDQLEALREKPGNLWNKYLLDEVFYTELWQDTRTDLVLWFAGAVSLLYLISGIYTMDEKRKMCFLIRSTCYGRKRIDQRRTACAFLSAGMVFVMTELPLFLRYYKIDHFLTGAQRLCDITTLHFSDSISIGAMIMLLFMLKALSFAAVCFAGLKLSKAIKSEIPALFTGIGIAGVLVLTLHHFETDIAVWLTKILQTV